MKRATILFTVLWLTLGAAAAGNPKADPRALADVLAAQGLPAHLEVWGGDVSHDWYWWGKEFGMFAERLFG